MLKQYGSISLFILCTSLTLQNAAPSSAQKPAKTEAWSIGMVTGSAQGTYYAIGQDIAKQAKTAGVHLDVKASGGSLDNIRRLVSPENAALGIVQSDVLHFLRRSSDRQSLMIAERLRVLFSLYNEEVHVLARRDIMRVQDLQGKRVVVGLEKSGNWVTATYLLHLLGIEPGERLPLGPEEALNAVLVNHADAMFYVVGKPALLFQNLPQRGPQASEAVHLIHITHEGLHQKGYDTSTIGPKDYAWLKNTVETVAVKALLVGFDFSAVATPYAQQRCDMLEKLGKTIREHLPDLQRDGHTKWHQVNLDADLGPWQSHRCLLPASLRTLPLGPRPKATR